MEDKKRQKRVVLFTTPSWYMVYKGKKPLLEKIELNLKR